MSLEDCHPVRHTLQRPLFNFVHLKFTCNLPPSFLPMFISSLSHFLSSHCGYVGHLERTPHQIHGDQKGSKGSTIIIPVLFVHFFLHILDPSASNSGAKHLALPTTHRTRQRHKKVACLAGDRLAILDLSTITWEIRPSKQIDHILYVEYNVERI